MKPKLASKARLRFDRHSGQHMLLYPERGLALNDSATAILKRCDGTRTIDEIADELARETGAPRDAIATDINQLVEDLARRGVVER